jgi:predicted Zn-dependent peptidase
VLHHDRVLSVDEVVARYRSVSADDVRRVLDRVLVGAARTVAVVGPLTKRDVVAALAA